MGATRASGPLFGRRSGGGPGPSSTFTGGAAGVGVFVTGGAAAHGEGTASSSSSHAHVYAHAGGASGEPLTGGRRSRSSDRPGWSFDLRERPPVERGVVAAGQGLWGEDVGLLRGRL